MEPIVMVSKSVHWNEAHSPKFQKGWFGPYKIQYYLPNNIILLVTINKFDPNLILVYINKLKPYKFVEDQTLQPILTKTSVFLPKEPIEVTHSNMFIK